MPARPAVVLTREHADNQDLASALERAGVSVMEIPCVSTRFRDPDGSEVAALPTPSEVGAIAFTSRRGVLGWERWSLGSGGGVWPGRADLDRVTVCCVGPKTRAALEERGVGVSIVADPPSGEALAAAIRERLPARSVVVLVGGEQRAGDLEEGLAGAGFDVRILTVYANDPPQIPSLDPFPVAAVFVASPSAGRRLIQAMPWLRDCRFVAIGSTTGRALAGLGIDLIHEASAEPAELERVLVDAAQE